MDTDTAPAAAVYCRISSDRGGEGLGVERQERLCRELADRKGWTVAEVYTDNDISAYAGKARPAYMRMLADLKAGTRKAVVVVDQDRLTRHQRELEDFIDVADRYGVALANVSGDLDLATSDGRFRARILGAVARQESEKKSERLKRQREQAARHGLSHGGRRPFGYERGGMELREEEALLIKDAAARFLDGESLRTIAKEWNERGIRASGGGQWSVTSLRTMLGGPRIAALRVHQGELVGEAAWPAIIDRETHERLKAALGDVRRVKRGRPPTNLLTSMLLCGRCGGRMSSSRRKSGARRYLCSAQPGSDNCGRISVDAPHIEDYITEAVLSALEGPGLRNALERTEDGEAARLVTELRDAEERRQALATAYADGGLDMASWTTARARINEHIAAARRRLETLEANNVLVALPTDIRAAWQEGSIEWKRRIIQAVLAAVTVKPTQKRAWDPDRVEFLWKA